MRYWLCILQRNLFPDTRRSSHNQNGVGFGRTLLEQQIIPFSSNYNGNGKSNAQTTEWKRKSVAQGLHEADSYSTLHKTALLSNNHSMNSKLHSSFCPHELNPTHTLPIHSPSPFLSFRSLLRPHSHPLLLSIIAGIHNQSSPFPHFTHRATFLLLLLVSTRYSSCSPSRALLTLCRCLLLWLAVVLASLSSARS